MAFKALKHGVILAFMKLNPYCHDIVLNSICRYFIRIEVSICVINHFFSCYPIQDTSFSFFCLIGVY